MKNWKKLLFRASQPPLVALVLISMVLLTGCASGTGTATPTLPPGLSARGETVAAPGASTSVVETSQPGIPGAGETSIVETPGAVETSAANNLGFGLTETSQAGIATATGTQLVPNTGNLVGSPTPNLGGVLATDTPTSMTGATNTPTQIGGATGTPTSFDGAQPSPTIVGIQGTPTSTNTPTMTPTGPTQTPAPTILIPETGQTPGVTPTTPIQIQGPASHAGFNNINPQLEQVGQGVLNDHANLQAGINSKNAGQLKESWMVNTPDMVTGMPLVSNGKVFFADWGGNAYEVDASTGKVVWQKQVEKPKTDWPWYGFAGTGALGNGNFYIASVEGKAYALDQNTGEIVWQVSLSNNPDAGNLGKLLYANGKLYLGLASVQEPLSHKNPNMKIDFTGQVMALDAQTGKVDWTTPLVQPPGNGVAFWGSFAIDPNTNTLFLGTGNNYQGEATQYSDSVMALDANTGKIKWSTQVTSEDIWLPIKPIGGDYDFGAGPQLFNVQSNGKTLQLVGIGQKSGFYWAFDRNTGQVVWKTYIGYAGVAGGMRGEASYAQGYLFLWSNNGFSDSETPSQAPITVKALDAATGKNVWSVEKAQPAIGWAAGFLSNDVYFVGSLDGTIKGYRASDGQVVWDTKAPAAVGSPLVVDGNNLYVGVGVPSSVGGTNSGSGVIAYSVGPGQSQSQTPTVAQSPTASLGFGLTPSAIAGTPAIPASSPTPVFGFGLTPTAISAATQAPVLNLTVFPTPTP